MVLEALQVLGYSLGVLAWAGAIGTCASPEWRKNSQSQPIIVGTSLRYDGLWVRCTVYVAGQTHCEGYAGNTFNTGIQDVLQVCRGLMIASIVIGFAAIFVTVLGLKCVTIGGRNVVVKARVAMAGGLMFGVAGIFTGASVSYYAHQIVQEYYNPVLPDRLPMQLRFEYGHALYIGWATLVLGLLSAIVMISISFAIFSGSRNQVETDSASSQGHSYRPVSILQRVTPQNDGNIQMKVLSSGNVPPVPPQRQVRIQKNGPGTTQELNGSNRGHNSLPISSDRQHYYDERRRRSDRHRQSSERSATAYYRNDRVSATARSDSKKRQSGTQEALPSGLIRSVSGSLKQYL